jgi:hypothetical protein
MLQAINIFFFAFHISLIVFNCIGWIWPRLRRVHLITIGLTWASWILLGLWHGFGYCPFTDWHWQVLRRLGKTDLPSSYIKYLFDTLTGQDIPAELADYLTFAGLLIATLIALYLWHRRRKVS